MDVSKAFNPTKLYIYHSRENLDSHTEGARERDRTKGNNEVLKPVIYLVQPISFNLA